ncbi:uncharacterized protein BCR38DRAFT_405481 [Pseudomassariella vexata]|uniref:Uncharacterized protein n=1 Tax=Pseudomassariella vexata TaxID=1141098 RepID=A0A1Y2EG85_9PEZI|nr:uncharacterized protein BCR38DRAFT_405481 [Pseudomassariella vexata]ORY69805.1 hypothetical protein BCR38DRAFT_405481 [Pseudomassariella vexata]
MRESSSNWDFGNVRDEVRTRVKNLAESPQLKEKYLFYLQAAEEFELDGVTVEDFYDWIMEPFLSLPRSIPPPDRNKTPTLQDFFHPKTFLISLHWNLILLST